MNPRAFRPSSRIGGDPMLTFLGCIGLYLTMCFLGATITVAVRRKLKSD